MEQSNYQYVVHWPWVIAEPLSFNNPTTPVVVTAKYKSVQTVRRI